MSQKCEKCDVVVYRRILMLEEPNKGKWFGVDCGCVRLRAIQKAQTNSFDITFDHVADRFGHKLHVSSMRELSAAEKLYGFQSVVLNSDAQNFDDPPQQKPINVADIHKWKYSDRRAVRKEILMTIPSERVRDTFRRRNYGKVEAPDNSKSATDNFHIDHSRLGVHDEYDAEAPNDWGGKGKFVPVKNDIRLNAIAAMGDLRAKSSYRSVDAPTNETGTGPCCVPTPFPPNGINPMYRRRRGE